MKRRLAKLAALLTALVLLPVCALPETANTPEDQTNIIIEKKTFPHLWCYNKKDGGKVSEGEMNLYFMDGGDIPYVALSEYMDFLSRLYSEVKKADIAYEIGVDAVANTVCSARLRRFPSRAATWCLPYSDRRETLR